MHSVAWVFGSPRRLAAAQRLGADRIPIRRLPRTTREMDAHARPEAGRR